MICPSCLGPMSETDAEHLGNCNTCEERHHATLMGELTQPCSFLRQLEAKAAGKSLPTTCSTCTTTVHALIEMDDGRVLCMGCYRMERPC